jgi:hypothetical protein
MKTLCLDFDGVVHSYKSGWTRVDDIPDPPVDGVFEFIRAALDRNFVVTIFSSRSGDPAGWRAMREWFARHAVLSLPASDALRLIENVTFPLEKPPAWVSIDDRALTFTGVWPSLDAIESFTPWYKKKSG